MTSGMDQPARYSAFVGHRRLAQGDLASVLRSLGAPTATAQNEHVLILDDRTGDRIEPDPRDDLETTLARFAGRDGDIPPPRGPPTRGRPRLGVVAKEVTLLPRHWDWLQTQAGGASAALRRLVDAARREAASADQARRSHRALDRFLYLVASDLPDFEEAYRAFYAAASDRFIALTKTWPDDVRDHARALYETAMNDRANAERP